VLLVHSEIYYVPIGDGWEEVLHYNVLHYVPVLVLLVSFWVTVAGLLLLAFLAMLSFLRFLSNLLLQAVLLLLAFLLLMALLLLLASLLILASLFSAGGFSYWMGQ
jgi:hypothetical protein